VAERRPLVLVGGEPQELGSGDALPASAVPAATLNGRGTTAEKPAAAAANAGHLYFDTTLGKMQRSNGTTWEDCEGAGSSSSGVSLGTALILAGAFSNV